MKIGKTAAKGSRSRETGFSGRVLHNALILFSALSFLAYGVTCIGSAHMKREFQRYGLARQRVWVGSLQLLAALGQLVGLSLPWIGLSASIGLAAMMLVGVLVRLRIKDRLVMIFPAFFYMILNAYLSVSAF